MMPWILSMLVVVAFVLTLAFLLTIRATIYYAKQ
jgi:hypothetical protein